MSNRSRLGLVAAAALVAVVALLALKPDDEGEEPDRRAGITAPRERPRPEPPQQIVLRGGVPRGGKARIEAAKGELVRFVVRSDASDEIHLHGYEIERRAAPGRPARFRLVARVEGDFEIESHTAQDAGREAMIGRLVVEP